MVGGARHRHLEGSELDAVQVLLRRRDSFGEMQLDLEISVGLLGEGLGQMLEPVRDLARITPRGEMPRHFLLRRGGGSNATDSDTDPDRAERSRRQEVQELHDVAPPRLLQRASPALQMIALLDDEARRRDHDSPKPSQIATDRDASLASTPMRSSPL